MSGSTGSITIRPMWCVSASPHALPGAPALAEVNPFWVEEPLMPDDIRGHAAIREKVSVPIATGEIEATRWGLR